MTSQQSPNEQRDITENDCNYNVALYHSETEVDAIQETRYLPYCPSYL